MSDQDCNNVDQCEESNISSLMVFPSGSTYFDNIDDSDLTNKELFNPIDLQKKTDCSSSKYCLQPCASTFDITSTNDVINKQPNIIEKKNSSISNNGQEVNIVVNCSNILKRKDNDSLNPIDSDVTSKDNVINKDVVIEKGHCQDLINTEEDISHSSKLLNTNITYPLKKSSKVQSKNKKNIIHSTPHNRKLRTWCNKNKPQQEDFLNSGSESEDKTESEYAPSNAGQSETEDSSNEDEDEDEDEDEGEDKDKDKVKDKDFMNSSKKIVVNEEKLEVEVVVKEKNAEDIITKQNFCLFCKKLQTKLLRHLLSAHKNEDQIKELKSLSKDKKRRIKLLNKIKGEGNFLYNTDRKYNTGKLIVARKPNEKGTNRAVDYTSCIKCKQFFTKSNIRHHIARCADAKTKGREHIITSRKMQGRVHPIASNLVRNKLLPIMRDDEIYRLIRFDTLIITFANNQCKKYKHLYQYDMVRSRLRYLAKILKLVQNKHNEVTELSEVYRPKYYGAVVDACNEIAGYDENSAHYNSPAVALNLGTLIKKVGNTCVVKYILEEDDENEKKVKSVLDIFSSEYSLDINKVAMEQKYEEQRQKIITLPSKDDISKLWTFVEENKSSIFNKLNEEYNEDLWRLLINYTVISILVFNRRRVGETERTLIRDFSARNRIDERVDPEVFKRLMKKEQDYARKYVRFEVRGKLNRNVPVIMDKSTEKCCELILKYRKQASVYDGNPYLFGLPHHDIDRPKFVRACGLLREFSEKCGANLSYTLRGTKLRKHVATTCVILNLSKEFSSDLADFLGHDKEIQKKHYQMPVAHRQILGVAKLLEIAQKSDEDDTQGQSDDADDDSDDVNNSQDETEPLQTKKADVNKNKNKSSRRVVKHWSENERSILETSFEHEINEGSLPSFEKIRCIQERNPCLSSRSEAQIKSAVSNAIKKKNKTSQIERKTHKHNKTKR